MARFRIVAATMLLAAPALAESAWVESGRLEPAELRALCERLDDVRLLARMQMIASGDARWRRLSRQALAIEDLAMGAPPLDPERCYVVARAGSGAEIERRAFEVREIAANPERAAVMVVGSDRAAP
jgi:hypothetical protein